MKKIFSLVLAVAAATTLAFADESKTVSCGSDVEIQAVPDAHYHFVQWSDGNTDAQRTVTVNEAMILTATFAEDTYYTLTLGVKIAIIEGEHADGKYYEGDVVKIQAVPDAADQCEEFKYWSDANGNTNAVRTLTFGTSDINIEAIFGAKLLDIEIKANAGGSVQFVTE